MVRDAGRYDPVTLSLPWHSLQPDNHRLMPVRRGTKVMLVTAPEYRLAKREAELRLAAQWRTRMLEGDVRLRAVLWFPDKRRRDLLNYSKLLMDAATGIIFADDAQVVWAVWEKKLDRVNPRVEIQVEEV